MLNFEVRIKNKEWEGIDNKMREIAKIASGKATIMGVVMDNIARAGEAIENSEILRNLRAQGYDFLTLDESELEQISRAFVDQAEILLEREEVQANGVLAASFRAAMNEYKQIVVEKIQENGYSGQLNPDYEDWKENTYGEAYPVGIASGQLLANLLERTAIRLVKSRSLF